MNQSQDSWVGTSLSLPAHRPFRALGMATRRWVKVLLVLSITTFQYLPYSHLLAHRERGSYATCHILWHSTSLEKDPWLLLETRRPCQGNGKEMGLRGRTISSILHLNPRSTFCLRNKCQNKKEMCTASANFTCTFSNSVKAWSNIISAKPCTPEYTLLIGLWSSHVHKH